MKKKKLRQPSPLKIRYKGQDIYLNPRGVGRREATRVRDWIIRVVDWYEQKDAP